MKRERETDLPLLVIAHGHRGVILLVRHVVHARALVDVSGGSRDGRRPGSGHGSAPTHGNLLWSLSCRRSCIYMHISDFKKISLVFILIYLIALVINNSRS